MAIRSELGSPGLGCPRFVVEIGLFLIGLFLIGLFLIGAFLIGGFPIAVGFDLVALATVVLLVVRFLLVSVAGGDTSACTLALTFFLSVGFSVGFLLAGFFLTADSVDFAGEARSIPKRELRSSSAMTAFWFFDLLVLVKESLN